MKDYIKIQSFNEYVKSYKLYENKNNKKSISQISDEIEELEEIKARYEKKGNWGMVAKTQDKIDDLDVEFETRIKKSESHVFEKKNITKTNTQLPDDNEIWVKARELDEKDFSQWMWKIQKASIQSNESITESYFAHYNDYLKLLFDMGYEMVDPGGHYHEWYKNLPWGQIYLEFEDIHSNTGKGTYYSVEFIPQRRTIKDKVLNFLKLKTSFGATYTNNGIAIKMDEHKMTPKDFKNVLLDIENAIKNSVIQK